MVCIAGHGPRPCVCTGLARPLPHSPAGPADSPGPGFLNYAWRAAHEQVQGTRADKPIIYSGMSHCFWHVVRHEGPAALMRGILPNLGKAAPAAAINFALYDWIRALMMGDAQGREGTNLDNYFQRPGNPFISTSREREGEGERRRQRGRGGRDCGETASQG